MALFRWSPPQTTPCEYQSTSTPKTLTGSAPKAHARPILPMADFSDCGCVLNVKATLADAEWPCWEHKTLDWRQAELHALPESLEEPTEVYKNA